MNNQIKKGDICKMLVDQQYDYRKIAWKDTTVLVKSVDGDSVTVYYDNDIFTTDIDWIEKYGETRPE